MAPQPSNRLPEGKLAATMARMRQPAHRRPSRSKAWGTGISTATALLLTACGGGGGGTSALGFNGTPEMLVCRARADDSHRFAEVALRTTRNLGTGRVGDRTGQETGARLHPDGVRVVFARERFNDDVDSRELYVSTIDGSAAELRLTLNSARDDEPAWSPDGDNLLFTSEENGNAGLWISTDRGQNAQPFLPTPTGFADGQADWSVASNRVVFSRRDPTGRHVLWLVNGSGFGEIPLTDGGAAAGPGNGDLQPTFSPDGATIAFVRRLGEQMATLCLADVLSGTVTVLHATAGEVGYPRFSLTADRVWFGLAEPDAGRQTLRLAHLPITGGLPTLAWPDERWQLNGLDFLPVAPASETGDTPIRLKVEEAAVQFVAGSNAFGAIEQLRDDDDFEYYLATATINDREVAGLNCRFNLPVTEPEDVLEFRVRCVVRASRIGGDSVFRISLRNLTDNRYDTVVELSPTSTGEQTMEFRTSSLRHVASEKELQFNVIADIDEGDRVDFWIDMVEVVIVPRVGQ